MAESQTHDRLVIGSSMKMHLVANEVHEWLQESHELLASFTGIDIFVLPPFVCLPAAAKILRDSNIEYGAQNMHWVDRGPYTGEVSPLMLKELGARYVELGHAERRRYFAETNETVNLKVKAALRHGLRPIICIGEEKRGGQQADGILRQQLRISLMGIEAASLREIIIAYEPIWAIGQGEAAEPDYVFERFCTIRWILAELHGSEAGTMPRLIYGGSVAPKNASALLASPEVQGLFVGRAALDPISFRNIIVEVIRNA
jgi:triosephosphate isomerase